MSNIFTKATVTVLIPRSPVRVRVALPGKPDTPREEKQYIEAELVAYYPNTDAYRMKYRGFAVIRPNEQVQEYGHAVYPYQDGLLEVNQLFLHPDDERDLELYCRYLDGAFEVGKSPSFGLRLEALHKYVLRVAIRIFTDGLIPRADDIYFHLLATDQRVIGRLMGAARKCEGWFVRDERAQEKHS